MVTSISKCLKLIRAQRNESLRLMASKLGISAAYLSSIEGGKRKIPVDFANTLFKTYDLNDSQRLEVMNAVYESTEDYRVDLTSCTEIKRRVIVSIVEDNLDDKVIQKLDELIEKSNNNMEREK